MTTDHYENHTSTERIGSGDRKFQTTLFGNMYHGHGRNKTASVDAAMRNAYGQLEGMWEPHMQQFRGFTMLVWRDPISGWGYRIIDADTSHDPDKVGRTQMRMMHGSSGGYVSRGATIMAAQHDMAQRVYRIGSGDSAELVANAVLFGQDIVQLMIVRGEVDRTALSVYGRGEFLRWVKWQERYCELRLAGMTDSEARHRISEENRQ